MRKHLLPIKRVIVKGCRGERFMISVPPSKTGTSRVRRFFKSWEAADEYCRKVAGPGGFFSAEQNDQEQQSTAKPLDIAVRDWLAKVYENDLSRPKQPRERHSSFGQARTIANALAEKFGSKPIDLIGWEELDNWIKGLGRAPLTRQNYWRVTKRFFKWCQEKAQLIDKNPMIQVDAPKVPYTAPAILTPEQMAICLQAVNGNQEHMAWLCLGGFAGIRSEEIYRMNWEDINWVDGIINVKKPKRVSRWHPRYLEEEHPQNGHPIAQFFQPLRRHLEPIALKNGLITKEKRVGPFRTRAAMMMGLEDWPENCLRHSFASYHVAVEKNFPKLQDLMGHADPRLTKYIYSIAIPRAEGERWWKL